MAVTPAIHSARRFLIRRFRLPAVLFVGVILYGVVGYTLLIDGADPIDALYWTTLSFGGVGFQDTYPLGAGAELFSISLIAGLVVVVGLVAGIVTDMLASGDLANLHRERTRLRLIDALRDHFIVCGFGRVGRAAVDELRAAGLPVLVVDINPDLRPELEAAGIPHVIADPSHDPVLVEAGIERARGLVCAADSDAVNVFIALTARTLSANLVIVARAAEAGSVPKLRRAGADEVVSPYVVSGQAMARALLDGAGPDPRASA